MKIENNTNMQPTSHNCSINIQQDKFFNKLTDELKALQTQLFEVEKKVNARDTVIDTIDLSTQSLSVGESTETKDLYVNNNASIQGELSANKATIDTLTVLNDFITQLLHVTDLFANTADIEEADIRSAIIDVLKIKQAITRFDTNQEIVSFPSENVTQIGDIANSILLAGLERPTWNGSPIALTSDLSMGLTPNYKGTVETEKELPPTAKLGDFYLINKLTRNGQTGLGGAIYGINKTWEITLYFELLNYFNKDEINQLFDEELTDDIQRETDIIKGNTPVQVVANGCVMKRDDGTSDRLATAVDAFMLSGPEGMDNIARNSSLDDLVICGQYSADDDLANTITEKPTNEAGAFDIAVGQFSGSKQDIYQLYTGKASQKNYFRIGLNKEFNNWLELAYTSSVVDKAKLADNLNAGATIGNNKLVSVNTQIADPKGTKWWRLFDFKTPTTSDYNPVGFLVLNNRFNYSPNSPAVFCINMGYHNNVSIVQLNSLKDSPLFNRIRVCYNNNHFYIDLQVYHDNIEKSDSISFSWINLGDYDNPIKINKEISSSAPGVVIDVPIGAAVMAINGKEVATKEITKIPTDKDSLKIYVENNMLHIIIDGIRIIEVSMGSILFEIPFNRVITTQYCVIDFDDVDVGRFPTVLSITSDGNKLIGKVYPMLPNKYYGSVGGPYVFFGVGNFLIV